MTNHDERNAQGWRIIGWIIAALAFVVEAGRQILDLVTGGVNYPVCLTVCVSAPGTHGMMTLVRC